MSTINLSKNWLLRCEPLSSGTEEYSKILSATDGWMALETLPADVHRPLFENGIIGDPRILENSKECEWIENRSFWFLKKFNIDKKEISKSGAELRIDFLDIHADIFLNGEFIAHHASAMYPFVKNIARRLRDGENTLLIRLTTGLEMVRDEDIREVRASVACEFRRRREGRGDERRCMLRKPQYVFGWDQSPRLATVALGSVEIEMLPEVKVRDIHFETLAIREGEADLRLTAEIESMRLTSASECDLTLTVLYNGKAVHTYEENFFMGCGKNYRDLSFTIKNPNLWWPNGYGEQPLYTVCVSVRNNNGECDEKEIKAGIRTVKLDTSAINDKERRYAFTVNGERIYARGSDFIHTNVLYAETKDEEQKKVLTSARDAGFTMLRFWDGNVYQSDYVYSLCDELGILVIQNFCFACSVYPDHVEELRREVTNEAVYQIKRIRSHPSLAIWYGNGENSSLLTAYLGRNFLEELDPSDFPGGTYFYNQLLPSLCHAYSPTVDYQCTTPFGAYGEGECYERGDRHYYPFLNLAPENQTYRISKNSIDDLRCKFITESGIMGPPSKEALIAYLGGEEYFYEGSTVLEHHKNTFERNAVRDGIYLHYTGERELSLSEYCLYGGLFQGMMIGYEAEHVRAEENSGGSLFWVLNDGFGEIGFSFLDRFGNPKPVYYFLKRAYRERTLIMKKRGDTVYLYATNASREPISYTVEYGYSDFSGYYDTKRINVDLPAHTDRALIASFIPERSLTDGIYYARAIDADVLPTTLFAHYQRELNRKKKPTLTVSNIKEENGITEFIVTSDEYAHAVYFDSLASVKYSDQYFDLLPGESRKIIRHGVGDIKIDSVF